MTIAELKALAQQQMDLGIETLRETGSIMQTFLLIRPDGNSELMVCEGAVSNDDKAKAKLGAMIRTRCRTGEIEAVIMLSDCFRASITKENEMIRKRLKLNVEEAAARGLCKAYEAVMVTVETARFCLAASQEYRRGIDNDAKIELVGEREVMDSEHGLRVPAGSRFSGFFQRESLESMLRADTVQ